MLNKTLKDTGNTMKSAANDLRDEVDGYASQAGRKARELLGTAGEEFNHATETVSKEIRNNPLRSGLIALGIGLAVGALLRK